MELKCSECCGPIKHRAPSDLKRRKAWFCSVQCADIFKAKKTVSGAVVQSNFDSKILAMKEAGYTYKEISETLNREKIKSSTGKDANKTLVQSRFNYLIGRRFGPVKVWRGGIKKFKIPKCIKIEPDMDRINLLGQRVELLLKRIETFENELRSRK